MSEYAKNIQKIEDLWKKRIELPKLTEIVRCRDCKHADEIMTRYAGMQYACMHFDDATVTPDGFCAWAERREP